MSQYVTHNKNEDIYQLFFKSPIKSCTKLKIKVVFLFQYVIIPRFFEVANGF